MKTLITAILPCIMLQSFAAVGYSANPDTIQKFNDKYIEIEFNASTLMIEFSLKNKSDKEIILDWENVRFIGLNGKSGKVMHSELKFSERLDTQTPESIAPHTTLKDFMMPATGAFFVYPAEVEKPTEKKVKVKMPIIIKGKIKEYVFTFDPLELYMKDEAIIKKAIEDNTRK